jgi:hypothetical protein
MVLKSVEPKNLIIMKRNILIFFVLLLAACEPRIELDLAQWGDHAFINNVQIFTLQVDNHQLQEYYTSQALTPAVRRLVASTGNAVIDPVAFTATVKVPAKVDLTRAGIIFYHVAEKIEPLNDAPKAGIIADFSAKNFSYKLTSADGTTHDWKIIITN